MAKVKEVFVCQSCGTPSAKWQGQCAGCGEWNTLAAEVRTTGARCERLACSTRRDQRPMTQLRSELNIIGRDPDDDTIAAST